MNCRRKMQTYMITGACIILAVLISGAYFMTDFEKEIMDSLSFDCTINGKTLSLRPWKDEEDGKYYLFLPSCFEGVQPELQFRYPGVKRTLSLDGIVYRNGDMWLDSGQEEIHQLVVRDGLGKVCGDSTIQVLTGHGLPAMMIEVEALEEILYGEESAKKSSIEKGELLFLNEQGDVLCEKELDKFKVRGNLTATLSKKPFALTLEEPEALLGMKPAVNWKLLANATDGSYIRNKIVLDMANQCMPGSYEPDGEFVELYLNGRYQGGYLLTEAVEIGENRLEIDPEDSWFLEMELDFRLEKNKPYVKTERGQLFAVRSDGEVTEQELQEIAGFLNDIESALYSENGISAISGRKLGELIDMDSWVRTWILQEISGDHDTGIASQFGYVQDKTNPVLYAGPVWDFDGSMGNVNTDMFRNPKALITSIENTREEGNPNQNRWLAAMYRNQEFQDAVKECYQACFKECLEEMNQSRIEGYVAQIGRSAQLDALRWHKERYHWPFVLPEGLNIPEEGDYRRFDTLEIQVADVRSFLEQKYQFLNALWVEERNFRIVKEENKSSDLNQDFNHISYYWIEE